MPSCTEPHFQTLTLYLEKFKLGLFAVESERVREKERKKVPGKEQRTGGIAVYPLNETTELSYRGRRL